MFNFGLTRRKSIDPDRKDKIVKSGESVRQTSLPPIFTKKVVRRLPSLNLGISGEASATSESTAPSSSSSSLSLSYSSYLSSSTSSEKSAVVGRKSITRLRAFETSARVRPASDDEPQKKKLCCDRCDGKHLTENCPYFRKERESHPDGQKNFYKKLGSESTLEGALLRRAQVIRQPGDGSCLFHSMAYGIGGDGASMRSQICSFIKQHPNFKINATPLSDWIKWDSGSSCGEYARRMSRGSWGGGIEMAVCSHIFDVNVHVYEKSSFGFRRISAFDHPDAAASKKIVRVIYQGGVHYDALRV